MSTREDSENNYTYVDFAIDKINESGCSADLNAKLVFTATIFLTPAGWAGIVCFGIAVRIALGAFGV